MDHEISRQNLAKIFFVVASMWQEKMLQIVDQDTSIVYTRREKEAISQSSHQNDIRLLSTREGRRDRESMCFNIWNVF
jgi:hypothetical protein